LRYHRAVTVVDRFAPRTTVAGGLLTSARVRVGLSQRELAARAGVAQSTIARIESGHADPAFSTLERLLAAADLEMRIHLESADDHDSMLDAIDRLRSPGERERVAAGHRRNVERFAEGGRRAGLQA
jgi:transcriptional regulator with XRE-family HTH domain